MDNPIIVGESEDALDAMVDEIMGETDEPEQLATPETEDAEEAVEAEPEAEPEEEVEYLEIKHNGKPVKLSLEEVIDHASKGFDYSQKTMEVAEQRRQVEAQAQMLQQQYQVQQANLQTYAELMSMDANLKQYTEVNWDAWMDSDPVEATKGWQKYQMLQNRRTETAYRLTAEQQRLQSEQQANLQRQLAAASEQLQRDIKGWGSELANELKTSGVTEYGFTDSEMNSIIDPRMVKVLHDAHQWRKLQTSKPQTLKKVTEAPKSVKPNNKVEDSQANRAKLMKQLKNAKSSRSREAIASALLDKYV